MSLKDLYMQSFRKLIGPDLNRLEINYELEKEIEQWPEEEREKMRHYIGEHMLRTDLIRHSLEDIIPVESSEFHWSCDMFHIFVQCGVEIFGIVDEDLFRLYKDEQRRRLFLEHHDSDYEYECGRELSDEEILKMTIERVADNLVVHQGEYNENSFLHNLPVFRYSHEKKVRLMMKHVKDNVHVVQRHFRRLVRMDCLDRFRS